MSQMIFLFPFYPTSAFLLFENMEHVREKNKYHEY